MVIKNITKYFLKLILLLLLVSTAITFLLSIIKIDHKRIRIETNNINANKYIVPLKIVEEEKPIGYLKINKIHLERPIYQKDSPKNNIEQNITILKESIYPNLMIFAAHSGYGEIAYFDNIDQLQIEDTIILEYLTDRKEYIVKEIRKEPKNGSIHIKKSNLNTLIITTCDKYNKNYQLIISCNEKES